MDYPVIYGQFTVVVKDQKWEDSFITSTLEIEFEQESSRTITHYQWREWTDFKLSIVQPESEGVGRLSRSRCAYKISQMVYL
ncbi:hypothetical protein ANCCEY_01919 [Ancylostoma ceylanicum]|uniref:Tyrosine-protein phosphatase domain-containing protein n=1 Tax=Ancylostoma ceylanicum TaxID=53326 RepID=A0A0D6M493_9BILA|nr:hypothetical protein ANCCEY_01919 [Ancylostoma ceylanicum]